MIARLQREVSGLTHTVVPAKAGIYQTPCLHYNQEIRFIDSLIHTGESS
jgi:hypothetical protein